MKYYIARGDGIYSAQSFESFNAAWDFVERYIPYEIHMQIYVLRGDEVKNGV